MSESQPFLKTDYAIIGGGVFGASTALHLSRQYPDASIALIDVEPYPSKRGASWDLNRVVRADYADTFYMRLGLESLHSWRSDPLLSPFFHESGIFWVAEGDWADTIVDNHRKLNSTEKVQVLPIDEAKQAYDGIFADANYVGSKSALVDERSGWADAKGALAAIIDAAVEAGVHYVEGSASTLEFHADGSCGGLRLATRQRIASSNTILSAGAGTAKLLADSAPGVDALQVGDRFVAAGIVTALVKMDPATAETFSKAPVCCQDLLPHRGGSFPLTADNWLKFWVEIPVRNTVRHPSGRDISTPPDGLDWAQWRVPDAMKDEASLVNKAIFGSLGANFIVEDYRLCWDAVSPTEDFVIAPHPASKNLFLATAGSFHAWKFLPILGKYVVQMVEGKLDDELRERWDWPAEAGDPSRNVMWPRRELSSLFADSDREDL